MAIINVQETVADILPNNVLVLLQKNNQQFCTLDFTSQYPHNVPSSASLDRLYDSIDHVNFLHGDGCIYNALVDVNSPAWGYIKFEVFVACTISLSAMVSSEEGYDLLYAHTKQDGIRPEWNDSVGRFVYISGEVSWTTYTSASLTPGIWYLHIGYAKDGGTDVGLDTGFVKDIKLPFTVVLPNRTFQRTPLKEPRQRFYKLTCAERTPFDLPDTIDIEGLYADMTYPFIQFLLGGEACITNVDTPDYSSAWGYIKFEVFVACTISLNAMVNSENGYDFFYAHAKQTGVRPEYNDSAGRFVYISGDIGWKTYTSAVLAPGIWYLHVGYTKSEGVPVGLNSGFVNNIVLPYMVRRI